MEEARDSSHSSPETPRRKLPPKSMSETQLLGLNVMGVDDASVYSRGSRSGSVRSASGGDDTSLAYSLDDTKSLAYSLDDTKSLAYSIDEGRSLAYSIDEGRSTTGYTMALTSEGRSLAYSYDSDSARRLRADDDDSRSRATGFVSAASGDGEQDDDYARQYHQPAFPQLTQYEHDHPLNDAKEQEAEREPTELENFLNAPMEYIFGGNDDDVSTLGGFNSSFSRWDGDASTIATTPTLYNMEYRRGTQQQPTILEEDEDASLPSSRRSGSVQSENDNEAATMPTARSHARSGTESWGEDTMGHVHSSNTSFGGHSRSTGHRRFSVEEVSQDGRSPVQFQDYIEEEEETVRSDYTPQSVLKKSSHRDSVASAGGESYMGHSTAASTRYSSVMDTDAEQMRKGGYDDRSFVSSTVGSRSDYSSYDDDDMSAYPRKPPKPWTADDSASVRSSRLLQRSASSGVNWRSTRSEGFRPSGSVSMRSFRSTRSLMPEEPEVVKFNDDDEGGPTMTVGMSGRAVVHVNLEHGTDGTIEKLEYTSPLVERMGGDDATVASEEQGDDLLRSKLPWYNYYRARSTLIRKCHTRQCYRLNIMILLGICLLVSVLIAIFATMGTASQVERRTNGGTATTRSSAAALAVPTLSDLIPPPAQPGITLSSTMDRHLHDWFSADGKYAASPDDVPFFWHIPLAGATIAAENWGSCLGFTVASDVGRFHTSDTLRVVQVYGMNFVNVDTSTVDGIHHAANLTVVPSGLPDVLFSPLFLETVDLLYSKTHPNKLIVTMQHPVDRAVAMFHYLSTATWDPSYSPRLATMSLEQYALGARIDNNYVTRLLTGKLGGSLTNGDLRYAKEILRRKALVGTLENFGEAMAHFERYFGWKAVSSDALNCQARIIQDGLAKTYTEPLDEGSTAYTLIRQQNLYDLNLYDYVKNVLVPYQHEAVRRQSFQFGSGVA